MVARPATAPVNRPTKVGRFSNHQPTAIQVMAANDAATSVLRNATAVTPSTRNSLPALKPYQRNAVRSSVEHLAPPDIENRCERGETRSVMHHDSAGKIEHTPLLEKPAT